MNMNKLFEQIYRESSRPYLGAISELKYKILDVIAENFGLEEMTADPDFIKKFDGILRNSRTQDEFIKNFGMYLERVSDSKYASPEGLDHMYLADSDLSDAIDRYYRKAR